MSRTDYGAFHVERVARKQHFCGWECHVPIEAGEHYIRSSLPPHTDPNNSDHWWTQAIHGPSLYDCPPYRKRAPTADLP